MPAIPKELFDGAMTAAMFATPEQVDAAEVYQQRYAKIHRVEALLEANFPHWPPEHRRIVADEVIENLRPGEPLIAAVRRWVPDFWKEMLCKSEKGDEGQLISNPYNAYVLLKYHPDVRGSIRLNMFKKAVEVRGGALAGHSDIDDIVTAAQDWLFNSYKISIPFQDLGRRLVMVAKENTYDPIEDYLRNLKWDGTPRICAEGGWLTRYAGAEAIDPEYVVEVGRKWILAAISRALEPGSKTDVVLIMEGDQGLKKSSAFEALGGKWYADAAIALGDKDSKLLAASAWVVELPDMASFKRSEVNALKAFFATRNDTFRVPYGRGMIKSPRRCIFVTTTNDEEYLSDPTGNRRYWPVKCYRIDMAGLLRDRDQLWAEAVAIYLEYETCPDCAVSTDTVWGQKPRCPKHSWWLSPEMARIAAAEAKTREEEDVWTPAVLAFVNHPVRKDSTGSIRAAEVPLEITTTNCLVHGVGKPLENCQQPDKIRVGKILRHLGYIPDGKPHRGARVYVKKADKERHGGPRPPSKLKIV